MWIALKLSNPNRHNNWTLILGLGFFAKVRPNAPVKQVQVLNTYPHDEKAFCQGLLFHQGFFYESTGHYGFSSLRKVEIKTGRVVRLLRLPEKFHGEGLANSGDRLIQLTWKSQTGFVRKIKDFSMVRTFTYPMEGWGITHDGCHFIMSDGSSFLYFLNDSTFQIMRKLRVRDGRLRIKFLNDLEYIRGDIFANVWLSERIAVISPETGMVKSWIDCSGLLKPKERKDSKADVLNGIAYDPEEDRIFVTGKNWPKVFEIKIKP